VWVSATVRLWTRALAAWCRIAEIWTWVPALVRSHCCGDSFSASTHSDNEGTQKGCLFVAVIVAVLSPRSPSVSIVRSTSFLSPAPVIVSMTGFAAVTPVSGSVARTRSLLRAIDEGQNRCDIQFGAEELCNRVAELDAEQRAKEKARDQLIFAACGMTEIPVLSQVCDFLNATIAAGEGRWGDAALNLTAMIPGAGEAPGFYTILKLIRSAKRTGRPSCRTGNSFSGDTRVLLAGGTTKRIADIRIGDYVLATAPELGITRAEPVIDTHRNTDTDLADLTVQDQSGRRATIRTTQEHLFWSSTSRRWIDAVDLTAGTALRSVHQKTAHVVAVDGYSGVRAMYDLTVADLHTYYVLAGKAPVLVHNDDVVVPKWARDEIARIKAGDGTPRINDNDGSQKLYQGRESARHLGKWVRTPSQGSGAARSGKSEEQVTNSGLSARTGLGSTASRATSTSRLLWRAAEAREFRLERLPRGDCSDVG
jgi:hypothetical protein